MEKAHRAGRCLVCRKTESIPRCKKTIHSHDNYSDAEGSDDGIVLIRYKRSLPVTLQHHPFRLIGLGKVRHQKKNTPSRAVTAAEEIHLLAIPNGLVVHKQTSHTTQTCPQTARKTNKADTKEKQRPTSIPSKTVYVR